MEKAERVQQPKILTPTSDLTREQWLEFRRKGIGGSDAASVLGISPFRTGVDLYYDKTGLPVEDGEENWVAMEVGTLLEDLVARIFEKKTGLKVIPVKFMLQHAEHPFMLADIDRMVMLPGSGNAILECKTTNYNARDKWEYDGKPIVPEYYEAQGRHYMAVMNLDRVGEKSYQNLWDAIQRSRNTTFERYLIAMDIPMIGNTASRALAKQFHSSLDEFEDAVICNFDFTQLPDFGDTLHQNIHQWFQSEENWYFWSELRNHVTIAAPAMQESAPPDNPFVGKTIVVTGKVEPYTRDGINAKIESLGAHAGSSVSGKTDYLVCGENAGSKLSKAQSLGVTVLTPMQFFQMAGE